MNKYCHRWWMLILNSSIVQDHVCFIWPLFSRLCYLHRNNSSFHIVLKSLLVGFLLNCLHSSICKVALKQLSFALKLQASAEFGQEAMIFLPIKMEHVQPPTKLTLAPLNLWPWIFNCVESWAAADSPNLGAPPRHENMDLTFAANSSPGSTLL